MEQQNLKIRIQRGTRTLTEHILTLTIWIVWGWSASRAGIDWEMVLFKAPTLPVVLEIGAVMSVILLVILWVRAYYSLKATRPMPLHFELDPHAEQKCLAMIGWDTEKQALAQKTQCFSVSTGREDLKCQISM
jgi:hypothetical protein